MATKKKRRGKPNKNGMTAKQYQAAIDKLGMSQIAAGRLLKVGPRTSRRWALDETPVPPAVAMLLHLMVKGRVQPEELEQIKS